MTGYLTRREKSKWVKGIDRILVWKTWNSVWAKPKLWIDQWIDPAIRWVSDRSGDRSDNDQWLTEVLLIGLQTDQKANRRQREKEGIGLWTDLHAP